MPTPDPAPDHSSWYQPTTSIRTTQSTCPGCHERLTAMTTPAGYPHTGRCNCGNRFIIHTADSDMEWVDPVSPFGVTVGSDSGQADTVMAPRARLAECPGCGDLVAIQPGPSSRYPVTGSCRRCETLYIIPAPGLGPLWDTNHAQQVRRGRRDGTGGPSLRAARRMTPEEEARRLEEEAVYRLEQQQRRRPDDERPDPVKDEPDQ